jgi:predicted ArsR family transcriptional regulator
MAPIEWSQRFLASTRGRIVARLRRGPATVEELAAAVGLTDNGIRVHLATLERDGWIHPGGVRRMAGPGKPATVYELVPEGELLLSTAYRPLLVALLSALAERAKPAEVDAVLRDAGRRLADEAGDGRPGGAAARAVHLLESLGGAVEVEPGRKGHFTLRGLGCPVGAAVQAEPRVCRAVTALLAGVLDADVQERCDRAGPPRCRFEVAPRAP